MFFLSTISATFFWPQQSSLNFAPTLFDLTTVAQDNVGGRRRYVILTSTVSAHRGPVPLLLGTKE